MREIGDFTKLRVIDGGGIERCNINRKAPKCAHRHLEYSEGDVFLTCTDCKSAVNPIVILKRMLSSESWWRREKEEYLKTIEKLRKRNRTKCHHCLKMTPIDKKSPSDA